VLDAFHLAATGTRAEIRAGGRERPGPAKALLKAVLAQYDGDVDGAVRILRHQLKVAPDAERVYFAEMLAPILIMRHDAALLVPLAELLEGAGWRSSALAFQALAAIERGDRDATARHAEAAAAALVDEADDVVRARVLQRLARAAFYLHDYDRALDLALSSAAAATTLGAWRVAAAAYSVAYNVHQNVTGAMDEADRFAHLWRTAAAKTGDESFLHSALVAEYELAVHFADEPRSVSLEKLIAKRLLPQQYAERFPLAAAMALARGKTDPVAMRTLLQVLRDTPNRSRGQWSLCTGLIAVADAAVADDESARRNIRAGIARLGRASSRDPAYEQRYRRLARASLAAACVIVGDAVRADRMLAADETRRGERVDNVVHLIRTARWDDFAASHRGFALVYRAAIEKRRRDALPAGLTPSEFRVLVLLGNGWSAGRIAAETQRSVNTVYVHTRSILAKLEVSRAAEAVAAARERGLI
jgi:DNA-binding CsgD family transcriptional regulator